MTQPRHFSLRTTQAGFTLIEILVALVLGLIVAGGIIQIYLGSKQSYLVQEQLSRLQESGRVGMDFMARYIRQAGYRGNYNDPLGLGQSASGYRPLEVTGGDSDTITVRFQSNGEMDDCLGLPIAANGIGTSTFSVENGSLFCTAGDDPTTRQPLVDGIRSLKVLLGEQSRKTTADDDDAGTGSTLIVRYLPPTSPELDMDRVVSMRVMLMLSDPTSGANAPQPKFQSTFALRNRLN